MNLISKYRKVFVIAFVVILITSSAYSKSVDLSQFSNGKVGFIHIGMRLNTIENRVGHKLSKVFMGDLHFGVTLTRQDLRVLGLLDVMGKETEEVVLTFRTKNNLINMIALEVPCDKAVNFMSNQREKVTKIDEQGSWATFNNNLRYGVGIGEFCTIFVSAK